MRPHVAIRFKKNSFSLVEVLVSLVILGMTSVPIMNDAIARIKTYTNIHNTLQQEIELEECFFRELAWLATSEEVNFALLDAGYQREHILKNKKRIIAGFTVTLEPDADNIKARLGELTVCTSPETEMSCSISLAFEEK